MKRICWTYLIIMALLFGGQYYAVSMSGTQYTKQGEIEKKPKREENTEVSVYFHNEKEERKLELEEYLVGVVCAEMPSSYNLEALKAQAVAARTYTYVRMQKGYKARDDSHLGCAVCTDFSHCQAYTSKQSVLDREGKSYGLKKWRKIQKAVNATQGEIITYNGKIANPLFHASSGGMTEDASLVWGGKPVAYLKSVESKNEEGYSGYKKTVKIDKKEALAKLKSESFATDKEKIDLTDIRILERSKSNRVMKMSVLGKTFTGTEIRTAWGLRSTMFYIVETKDELVITTLGYGHGVGMSQYGANAMAKSGGSYEEILKHYYTGVELGKIEQKK